MRDLIKYFVVIMVVGLGMIACKPKAVEYVPPKLSDLVDSVIYEDLKFGITKNEFLQKNADWMVVNKMSEPAFDTIITEVESSINIDSHLFRVYYYFDNDDSLYRVKAESRHQASPNEHKATCTMVGKKIYMAYGIPVRWKTIVGYMKFGWVLKNKQILLEYGCVEGDCFVECMITEWRLFLKGKGKA